MATRTTKEQAGKSVVRHWYRALPWLDDRLVTVRNVAVNARPYARSSRVPVHGTPPAVETTNLGDASAAAAAPFSPLRGRLAFRLPPPFCSSVRMSRPTVSRVVVAHVIADGDRDGDATSASRQAARPYGWCGQAEA
eukprot:229433-Chlamydomonas_euryale.AAC.2